MARVYYPRCSVVLRVPVLGAVATRKAQTGDRTLVEIQLSPRKVTISRNDFNTADECNLTFGMETGGVDPRLLSNAIVEVYIDDMRDARAAWANTLRFVGIATSARRRITGDNMEVDLKALDYTTLFLAQKPVGKAAIPSYSLTLREAWALICDNVGLVDYEDGGIESTVSALRDNPVFIGIDGDIDIGSGVIDRVKLKGKVQADPNLSAWEVWRITCDGLGLLTFIDGDHVVVTTPKAYFRGETAPAVLRYGDNIVEMEEHRDLQRINSKGIHLTSFDPVTFNTIEAFYPERDNPNVLRKVKRVSAKTKKKAGAGLIDVATYEHFNYPYPVNEDALQIIAERVWEERSRQELQGDVTTDQWRLPRIGRAKIPEGFQQVDHDAISVFELNHGKPIMVVFDRDILDPMKRLSSVQARMEYLLERGYRQETARLLAEDAGFLTSLLPVFAIRSLEYELDLDSENFSCKIGYCSRFNPMTGSTDG